MARSAAAAPAPSPFRMVPTGSVRESPLNPRRLFAGLDELRDSIRAHGILEPLIVRPEVSGSTSSATQYEVIAGARRLRAANLAGLDEVPVLVRDIGDREACELMLVENGQREDVHPLEEAIGYQHLRDKYGVTVEELAEKTGKSVSWVRGRLRLTALCDKVRKLFLDGELSASIALELARIPSALKQEEAASDILLEGEPGSPISVRAAQELIRDNYMVRLAMATWELSDGDLVPDAGMCLVCDKRVEPQPDLLAAVSPPPPKGASKAAHKDDLCSDPACFATKKAAAWEQVRAKAEADGKRVLDEKESAKALPFPWNPTEAEASYAKLDEKVTADPKGRTVRQLVKAAGDVTVAVARSKDGKAIELVAKDKLFAALADAGEDWAKKAAPAKAGISPAEKKRREQQRIDRLVDARVIERIVMLVANTAQVAGFWRWVVDALLGAVGLDAVRIVAKRRAIEELKKRPGQYGSTLFESVEKYADKLEEAALRALAVELLIARSIAFGGRGEAFVAALKHWKIDMKAIEKAVRDDEKKETDQKGAKGKGAKGTPAADPNACLSSLAHPSGPMRCTATTGHKGKHKRGGIQWTDAEAKAAAARAAAAPAKAAPSKGKAKPAKAPAPKPTPAKASKPARPAPARRQSAMFGDDIDDGEE